MNINLLRSYALFANETLISLTRLENQGYNNTNYLLVSTKHRYLLRVFGKSSLDRKREFEIGKKAFIKGIGQKPLLLDSANNLMVIEFAKGEHCIAPSLRQLQRLGRALRTLHGMKWHQKSYGEDKEHTPSKVRFKKLKNAKKEPVLCHHDLNPKNILFHGHSVKLIDWEYARVNDRYFDLASLIVEFGLGKKETRFFLASYVTCKEKIDFIKLECYKKVYKALCDKWFKALAR
ncbi:phosphotransferase family protein [Sulfurospirillum sp. T05]|uniref:Phosphotransferase family protein n=1 Tax=Sulfurospirillum tamanense TaxID=2813362 RepID=A0ABS2WWH6_9BACT|nr:choline/ethanolamine kinase family protein [Sulfurospirillum tamanensis]MBN2965559.1 phosphotransferase family protein [Sulfurospirillum tamanensis]